MAYVTVPAGATSKIIEFPVYDSSSTIGALLAGLTYNASGMTAYYDLWGASGAASVMSLVTMTKGMWTSLGFVAVDATNMPGIYQLGIPNAALTGAQGVTIVLKGATNMVPVVIMIELTATSNQDGVHGGMTALPNATAGASGGLPTVDASNGVKISSGTGANQVSLSSGAVLLQATQTGVTIPTVTNLTNAPGTGDFTSTMKTSLNNATPVATLSGDLTATMKTSVTAAVPTVAAIQSGLPTDASVQTDLYTVLSGTAIADATSLTANSLLDRIRALGWIIRNQIAITDSTGAGTIYKDDSSTTAFSVSLTDNATTTTRTRAA